jgi:tetratricopeptide (TPR) repeat protein
MSSCSDENGNRSAARLSTPGPPLSIQAGRSVRVKLAPVPVYAGLGFRTPMGIWRQLAFLAVFTFAFVYVRSAPDRASFPGGASRAQPSGDRPSNQQADAAYQQGMRLLDQKRYSEALVQFQNVERMAPQLPQGPSGEGIALALMGKPDQAIQALQQALRIDSSFWVARRELGIVYWSVGRKDQAYEELQQLADLFPNDTAINIILGQYEFEKGNFAKVLSYFAKAPSPVERDARLFWIKGKSLLATGHKPEAGHVLQALADRTDLTPELKFQTAWALGQAELYPPAIKLFESLPADYPDRFHRNYGLGLAYFESKQYSDCVRLLKPLFATDTHPELLSLLGVAEEKIGDTKAAYDAFRQGILTNPRDAQNYMNIATLSCLHLNYDLALQILTSGIERIPDLHEFYLSRGIAYTLKASFDEARADFHRAISMAPDDPGNYVALGLCDLETGHLDDAVQSFEKAKSAGSKEPTAYYFLAEALIQKGVQPGSLAFAEAKDSLDKAVELDPALSYAYLDRAKLALRANQIDLAVSDLERARSIEPGSRTIAYLLAQTYQRKGEKEKADALFAQVSSASDEEARQFRKDALTQSLVVISGNGRIGQ